MIARIRIRLYRTNREDRNTDPRRTRNEKYISYHVKYQTFLILPNYTVPVINRHRSLFCAVRLVNIKIYGTGTVPDHCRYRHRSLFCAARLVNIKFTVPVRYRITVGTDIRKIYSTSIPYHKYSISIKATENLTVFTLFFTLFEFLLCLSSYSVPQV